MTTVERLLVMTLEIENALGIGEGAEVRRLMNARQDLLNELVPEDLKENDLKQLLEAETRVLNALDRQVIGLQSDLNDLQRAKTAGSVYGRRLRAATDLSISA